VTDNTTDNRLRRVAAGGTAFGVWCSVPSSIVAEQLALLDPDFVCVDCQHGLIDQTDMASMLLAMARTGVTTIVRVPGHDASLIGKALDSGADAIVVPMVNTADEAAYVASACRYAPTGIRSYGPVRANATVGSADTATLNAHVMCLVMIETERGVANADEICSTPGVDGVYIGPADLAISLGETPAGLIPGRHTAAVEHVLDRCQAHGIVPAIHSYDGASAARYAAMGFRMVTVGVDLRLLRTAVSHELKTARTP
jgi:4-hydroxy-2-oxoheptanedioate aldolase